MDFLELQRIRKLIGNKDTDTDNIPILEHNETYVNNIPPREMPPELYNLFTINGKISVQNFYFDGREDFTNKRNHTKEILEDYMENIKQKKEFYYAKTDTWLYNAFEQYPIQDQHVAVIGSSKPLYEAMCLVFGAKKCTVIEYNSISFNYPKLSYLTPNSISCIEKFDSIVSISSIEHDGLGRYGDPICPNGDILAMQKSYSMLRTGGLLYLAVPIGKDCIVWNAHRVYGSIRFPLLINGWELIQCYGVSSLNDSLFIKDDVMNVVQPVFVLKKL